MYEFWMVFFLLALAGALGIAAWMYLRVETVGQLRTRTHSQFDIPTWELISVRREASARDDMIVHLQFGATGFTDNREMSGREALQIALWLEAGCERSDYFGRTEGFEVSSSLEGHVHVVQLSRFDRLDTPLRIAPLTPVQARQIAQWLRIAAAPGRTVDEARRRMPKAPA